MVYSIKFEDSLWCSKQFSLTGDTLYKVFMMLNNKYRFTQKENMRIIVGEYY
jgi:hypothetical protein